jgi:hypothetical protein
MPRKNNKRCRKCRLAAPSKVTNETAEPNPIHVSQSVQYPQFSSGAKCDHDAVGRQINFF